MTNQLGRTSTDAARNPRWSDKDVASLFDRENGRIDPQIYTDEALYQQELELIFGRSWLLLGHETQIPKAGDFMTQYMGEDRLSSRGSATVRSASS